ncbi:hypothetical protein [Pseudonocardia humida]|uniref:DUF3039 domain-containing protein n=1 Tax=Pseudonocardia humida TaxID=2800819 RepID=A0ABT1AAK2_9PSEU|nr:hypothetical protein [Pseudonocardia humida]MCO1660028.1 hypothetical protein [Pseudonocardia humida]
MDVLSATLVAEEGPVSFAHYLAGDRSAELSEVGKAQAVCGRVFLPAALAAPLGRPCPLCEAVIGLALSHGQDAAAAGARRG